MRGTMVDETNEMDFELREIKRNIISIVWTEENEIKHEQ